MSASAHSSTWAPPAPEQPAPELERSEERDAILVLAAVLVSLYTLTATAVLAVAPGQAVALFTIALLQAAWLFAVRHLNRRVVLAGAVLNLLMVALWLLSRTVGLPGGPPRPQPVGVLDTLCAFDSAAIVMLALSVGVRPERAVRPARGHCRWVAIVLAVASLSALHVHGVASGGASLAGTSAEGARYHFVCQLL